MDLTQYRLAVDTGIPHSRISAIVAGRRAITPDTALRLARYFGKSPDFGLGMQEEKAKSRSRLRRSNPEKLENELYQKVWAKVRELGWGKQDVYDFALEKLTLKGPISSLKQLGPYQLKKLSEVIYRHRS